MNRLRTLAFAFWLAVALVAGQQVAVLHDLGHATERLSQSSDPGTLPAKCDLHFSCSQLGGAVGTAPPQVAFLAPAPPRPAATCERSATCAPRFAFPARAPPASLA